MALSYIEPVFFLYTLTLFMNIPLEKQLVYQKVCLNNYNKTFCDLIASKNTTNYTYQENIIQSESAQWDMFLVIARLVPTIISMFHLGAWSDGVGRKTVIIVGVLGESIDCIGRILNVWFFSAPLPYLLIGSILTGFSGNFAAITMGVLSYVGDTTTPNKRTTRMVVLDALVFLSSLIAFFASGVILEKFGFIYVYGVDIILYVAILLYMCFVRESYLVTRQVRLKDIFGMDKFRKFAYFFKQNGSGHQQAVFTLLALCLFSLGLCTTGIDNVLVLYLLHSPLTFTPTSIGLVLSSESIVKFFGAIVVSLLFIRTFKWRDSSLLLLCAFSVAGYSLSLGLSRHNWSVFVSTVWGLGVSCGVAACRSGLSKLVLLEDLGKLNALLGIIQNITTLLSGIVFNNIYQSTVHLSPSITLYVISGFCLLVPVALTVALKTIERNVEANLYENILP